MQIHKAVSDFAFTLFTFDFDVVLYVHDLLSVLFKLLSRLRPATFASDLR